MPSNLINQIGNERPPLYWRSTFFDQFESNFLFTQGETTKTWWCYDKNELISGFHGPFGGLQRNIIPASDISVQEVKNNLMNLLETYPLSKNVRNLRIRTYPESVFTNWSNGQEFALTQFGFKELHRDVVHYIEIQGDFKNAWNRDRKRDFIKTNQLLDVKEVSLEKDQMAILNLLERDASSKGRHFPLDKKRFQLMRRHLKSDEMNLFLCMEKRSGNIVAAAICQVIDNFSAYVYRWGVLPQEEKQISSPLPFLANYLYEFYQNLGMEILYLGTSSVDGIVNPGLAYFKESLGAKSGSNCVYTLEVNGAFSSALSRG